MFQHFLPLLRFDEPLKVRASFPEIRHLHPHILPLVVVGPVLLKQGVAARQVPAVRRLRTTPVAEKSFLVVQNKLGLTVLAIFIIVQTRFTYLW